MSAVSLVASVDDLFELEPIERFRALIAGPNFDEAMRAEPIRFETTDPIYGTSCRVPKCAMHSTQAEWWCTRHSQSRRDAQRRGIGEAEWSATALPFPPRGWSRPLDVPLPSCRFCPEHDATTGDLCRKHTVRLAYARKTQHNFDEEAWAASQVAFPAAGDCRVDGCLGRAEDDSLLCPRHRTTWTTAGRPEGLRMQRWLLRQSSKPHAGALSLSSLPALLEAEIRYALWTHTKSEVPARWHPMWLRTLVKSCLANGIGSLIELDPADNGWTPNPAAVNRIVREMLKDVHPIHRTKAHTRELGYLDTNYWGVRFRHRRSPFDLTVIPQHWLRGLAWDHLASHLDGPRAPRTQGPFEQARRSAVCFGTYLSEHAPGGGMTPSALTESNVRAFTADMKRRVSNGEPLPGVFNVGGDASIATATTYPKIMNALRKMMRWALESGTAASIGLPREFIVAFPQGGPQSQRHPRPFTDDVLGALSDPEKIALFNRMDRHDNGLADVWSIQVKCGRRIGEVIDLRLDCVGEHLGRTWMWVDMTKVGKLDYAIPIPRDVFELIRGRQAKTIERFRLKHGTSPTAKQRRLIALFPSRVTNPSFQRSISASAFGTKFKAWLELDEINRPGHTTHQARHTLATRLVNAGASMTHVKRMLGHVSERMSDHYVLIAGSQLEPFLQQIWVTGPGSTTPGEVVLTPNDADLAAAESLMVDLAAIPTEHGLCTFKPVVGGFDCPFGRRCDSCEHFVITGADYGYWKRQEERWTAMAEGAPDEAAREYIYDTFERSSQALAGLEKALLALGLLAQAKELDLRSPQQDFFEPIWTRGWRAGDLVEMGGGAKHPGEDRVLEPVDHDASAAS